MEINKTFVPFMSSTTPTTAVTTHDDPTTTHWIVMGSPLLRELHSAEEDAVIIKEKAKDMCSDTNNADMPTTPTAAESTLERAARLFPKFTICDEDEADPVLLARAINDWMIDPVPESFYHKMLFLREHPYPHSPTADRMFAECSRQIADAEGNPGNQAWWRTVQILVGPPELSRYHAVAAALPGPNFKYDVCVRDCRRARLIAAARCELSIDKSSFHPQLQLQLPQGSIPSAWWFRYNHRHDWTRLRQFLQSATGLFSGGGGGDNEGPEPHAVQCLRWLVDVCYHGGESCGVDVVDLRIVFLKYANTAAECQVLEDAFPGIWLTRVSDFTGPQNVKVFAFILRLHNDAAAPKKTTTARDNLAHYLDARAHPPPGPFNVVEFMRSAGKYPVEDLAAELSPQLRVLVFGNEWRRQNGNFPCLPHSRSEKVLRQLRRAVLDDCSSSSDVNNDNNNNDARRAGNVQRLRAITVKVVKRCPSVEYLGQCARAGVLVWPLVGSTTFKKMIAACAMRFMTKRQKLSLSLCADILFGGRRHGEHPHACALFHGLGNYLRNMEILCGSSFGDWASNVVVPIGQWIGFTAESLEPERIRLLTSRLQRTDWSLEYAGEGIGTRAFTKNLKKEQEQQAAGTKRKHSDE